MTQKIVNLICGSCGNALRGVQHFEKDTGYGTCERCQTEILLNPRWAIGHPIQVYDPKEGMILPEGNVVAAIKSNCVEAVYASHNGMGGN